MAFEYYNEVDLIFFAGLFFPGGDEMLGYLALISIFTSIAMMIRLVVILPSTPRPTRGGRIPGRKNIRRTRRSFHSLRCEYGSLFRRAYRMDYEMFCKLLEILRPKLEQECGSPAPNGKIPIELKLSAALRWFGGGSYLDILISHGLSKAEVYNCAWDVVEAIIPVTGAIGIKYVEGLC
jgi:hypothetical protein